MKTNEVATRPNTIVLRRRANASDTHAADATRYRRRFNPSCNDGLDIYRRSDLRQFRKSLSSCLTLHQRTMYEGKSEKEYYENRLMERTLKRWQSVPCNKSM